MATLARVTLQGREVNPDEGLIFTEGNTPKGKQDGTLILFEYMAFSNSNPPLFGSTAHRPGMDAEMSELSLRLQEQYNNMNTSSDAPCPAFEAALPNQAGSSQHQGHPGKEGQASQHTAKSQLANTQPKQDTSPGTAISEPTSPRGWSTPAYQYWRDDKERDLWQRALVAELVRAKHEQLDAEQHPILRYGRKLVKAKKLEMWYQRVRLERAQAKGR